MLQLPPIYKRHQRSPLDCVYQALRNKDLADCVVLAIRVFKQTNNFIVIDDKKEKSAAESLKDGIAGKEAFCQGDYQMALVKYNMALMRAPPKSEAMRLSYYSRAELALKTKQFQACLKDVETCLTLNCPDSMAKKLREMKEAASAFAWVEQLARAQP